MKDILQYLAKSDSFTILSYTLKAEYTVTERLTINHGYISLFQITFCTKLILGP